MPKVSHATGGALDYPTPAQFKEFFAQVDDGRINKRVLQHFLNSRKGSEEGKWFSFSTTKDTLRELREYYPTVFFEGPDDDWWVHQAFADRPGEVTQVEIFTSAAPGSFNQTWDERKVPAGQYVPTARELVEGMIACFWTTKKMPFGNCFVRTCDIANNGRINVASVDNKVFIGEGWENYQREGIGLALARKGIPNPQFS